MHQKMHKKGMKRKWKTFIVKEKMSGLSKCMENIYGQIDSLRSWKSFFLFSFFFWLTRLPSYGDVSEKSGHVRTLRVYTFLT